MTFIILQYNNDTTNLIGVCIGGGIAIVLLTWVMISNKRRENIEYNRRASLSIEQRFKEDAECEYGKKNTMMICPHCQSKGTIRIKPIKKRTGISGGKATAAVLTGGVSVLATGLSHKEDLTQAHCGKCKNTWTF
ncbi:MAG TPA: hypothetical protein PLE74_12375 [Candidatus Cloacimonadota bacterium]|nr:hypothetical protein [Candidatus Cloacimonadota bacterium]